MPPGITCRTIGLASVVFVLALPAAAQPPPDHDHSQIMLGTSAWHFMQDGVLFALFNHQGGPRGGDEVVLPNWWMAMASRPLGRSQLTFNAMFSVDAATVGKDGYREIFQVGEVVDNQPLVDRQHPHDAFMQLAAVWRTPLTATTGLTFAGGPVGEPALGPVAFMHRASALENPFAALSHHTFDSTHIAFGVVTVAVDRGRWTVEGSAFNGREPDEDRWNFDFGPLDSVSGRIWFRPDDRWEFQVSTGRLAEPEELEPGDIQRTTASGSWLRTTGSDLAAVTVGFGVNDAPHGTRHSIFGEAARRWAANTGFMRAELVQVETSALLNLDEPHHGSTAARDAVGALTLGFVRDLLRSRGWSGGAGGAVTLYAVPNALEPSHGKRPLSFQFFFRLRPPAGSGGRMLNMHMTRPMPAPGAPAHIH
jgi:hypothetical protein